MLSIVVSAGLGERPLKKVGFALPLKVVVEQDSVVISLVVRHFDDLKVRRIDKSEDAKRLRSLNLQKHSLKTTAVYICSSTVGGTAMSLKTRKLERNRHGGT